MMAGLDPNAIAIKIKETLKKAEPFFPAECCIYKVPNELRRLNPDAYTPKAVSIGPFHCEDPILLRMGGQKQVYCQALLARSETSLEALVSCVQELEPKIRRSYSQKIELSEEEFVKVILIDSGFIFELFLRYHYKDWPDNDSISLTTWLRSNIKLDFLLLENQIPFFVLEKLYNLAFASRLSKGDEQHHPSLLRLTFHYFKSIIGLNIPYTGGKIEHFTDLLRAFHLQPSANRPQRKDELLTHFYSATELNEAGVKFKVKEPSNSLLDLEFSSGSVLEIPKVTVEDSTEILLRNVVALEQCHYPDESYVTDYIAFLDFLINTDKDVDFLVKKGILVNWLGESNAVAQMINGLWKNVTQANFNAKYLRIGEELNIFCKHPVNRRVATLRRDYCNTTWKKIASSAAILLLILTVIQTVCSILQVK